MEQKTKLRVKELREARGWSQRKLAAESGLDLVTVNHVETGKRSRPHLGTLESLAKALGVSVRDLLDE
jgi:transcriptional regulator with XRE-family HTH domain